MITTSDQQSESIKLLIHLCSDTKESFFETQALAQSVGINKRRFHDILNVFETMGCIHKITTNLIRWNGFEFFQKDIMRYAAECHVWDRNMTISRLLPSKETCTICALTKNVFILFIALNIEVLNMKDICLFTVRKHGKLQSIMCKLYQIIHILVAADFVERRDNGDIKLLKPFLKEEDFNHDLSIVSLLNDPIPYRMDFYKERREEFEAICQKQKKKLEKKAKENNTYDYSE